MPEGRSQQQAELRPLIFRHGLPVSLQRVIQTTNRIEDFKWPALGGANAVEIELDRRKRARPATLLVEGAVRVMSSRCRQPSICS